MRFDYSLVALNYRQVRDRFAVQIDLRHGDFLMRYSGLKLRKALIEAPQEQDADLEKLRLTASVQLDLVDLDDTMCGQAKPGDEHDGRRKFSEGRGAKSA